MTSSEQIREVAKRYIRESNNMDTTPIEVGHIHSSWVVHGAEKSIFLQKVNNHVFENIKVLDQNISKVTTHLAQSSHGQHYDTLQLLRSHHGESMLMLEGNVWRAFSYHKDCTSWTKPLNRAMVEEAAKAFASFVQGLSTLPFDQISDTLEEFHSLEKRITSLESALTKPIIKPTEEVHHLVDRVKMLWASVRPLEEAATKGNLPIRIIHNDAKLNNLLFDHSHKVRCVVDLDTVMPGLVHYDVGDALRTMIPSHDEESGHDSMTLNLEYYTSFKTTYTQGNWLTVSEFDLFDLAAPYMATIMGVRFLTDYLLGNVYFKTKYSDQNFERAKNQLHLATLFLETLNLK